MIPQIYELGQKVTFSHALSRSTTPVGAREWHSHPYEADAAREQQGIIVGKRRLANGAVRWEEWGAEFDASEYFTAYLIAFDLRRTPVFVRPEHINPTLPVGETTTGLDHTPCTATEGVACIRSRHPCPPYLATLARMTTDAS